MPLVSGTTLVLEVNLFFAYPYSTYALPAELLDTFIVKEVEPILSTLVDTGDAAVDFCIDSKGKSPRIEKLFRKVLRGIFTVVKP
jgi:hypothetical protein